MQQNNCCTAGNYHMRIITEYLPDGTSDFRILHLAADLPDGQPPEHVVVANGYLEDATVLQASAEALIHRAEQEGQPMQITLHDSPMVGARAYGLSYRTERYERVVDHVTHGELPVRLSGHSWGLPQVVTVGHNRLANGLSVESVTGINPNGLTPVRINPASVVDMLYKGVLEARLQAKLLAECDVTAVRLGRNALTHILSNIPGAVIEGYDILTHDFVQDAVDLHGKLKADGASRMKIVGSSLDGVCPSGIMRKNLIDAGFPEEDFVELETCHGGPLIDPELVGPIYNAVLLRRTDSSAPFPTAA